MIPSLSLALIVRDTEKTLDRCLSSLKPLVDEIIVVDTGSVDKTVEIARKYTDAVYFFKWVDDFSAARNFAFEKCTKDWICWVDGDDYTLPEDIAQVKKLDFSKDVIICNYVYASDDQGEPVSLVPRERFIRRSLGLKWEGEIHEYLPLKGVYYTSNILFPRHHKQHGTSERNIKLLESALKKKPDNSRNVFYYGTELMDYGRTEEGLTQLEKYTTMPGSFWEDVFRAHYRIAEACAATNEEKFKYHLFESIKMEERRAEPFYLMGRYWELKQQWLRAVQWYEMATCVKRPPELLSAYQKDYYTWMPCLQLCVCYNAMGDLKKSFEWNERALSYKPTDSRMLNNKRILISALDRTHKVVETKKDKLKIGWITVENWDAAQTRIRVLRVSNWLKEHGYDSDVIGYSDAINKNYPIVIVGKSFSEADYQAIRELKKNGKIVLCDLCEQILDFPWVKEILSLSDIIICCSRDLAKRVEENANKNTVIIEDAYEGSVV